MRQGKAKDAKNDQRRKYDWYPRYHFKVTRLRKGYYPTSVPKGSPKPSWAVTVINGNDVGGPYPSKDSCQKVIDSALGPLRNVDSTTGPSITQVIRNNHRLKD